MQSMMWIRVLSPILPMRHGPHYVLTNIPVSTPAWNTYYIAEALGISSNEIARNRLASTKETCIWNSRHGFNFPRSDLIHIYHAAS